MAAPTYARIRELFRMFDRLFEDRTISDEEIAEWIHETERRFARRQQMLGYLDQSIDDLEISVRSANCLKNSGIRRVYELVKRTEAEMLKTKNFGRKSLLELRELLAGFGLSFGMESVPGLELPPLPPSKPLE
ncbi:hypothetical protein HY442_01445 [Candidatus Parcubacteria bacterium]|nr:hypothetical protein [Candidatus Parcubacteria bacterium]